MKRTAAPVEHPFSPPQHERHWVDTAAALAADFAATAAEFDAAARLPVRNLEALHGSGLDAALLPRQFGGQELSYRSYTEIVSVLSAACPSTACLWVMHIGAAISLVRMSVPQAARFYADELAAGRRFANALSEPTGGNLFLLPLQTAKPVDGGFELSGAKRFVSGCEIADHLLVNALVDGAPTFFGVAPDASMTFVDISDTMGLRATRSQLVTFDNTLLREDRRCPPATRSVPNHISAGLAFLSLGIADAAVAAIVEHAQSRIIPGTGEPLANMQWLRFDLAEAHTRLEAARMYARNLAWLADENSPDFRDAAVRAKTLANQVARDVAQLALQVGGGSGYLTSSPIQRLFRDAQAGGLMAYSLEVCKDRIGADLLASESG